MSRSILRRARVAAGVGVGVVGVVGAVGARAGVMLQPTGATSGLGSYSAQYVPAYAIDQSALSAGYTSGVTDFDSFAANTHTVAGGSGLVTWYSAQGVLTGNFDFNLGGTHTIESFALWNDPQVAHQGINGFRLYADGSPAFATPVLLGSYTALDGIPDATNVAQVFTFTPTSASYVRMEILSNHGSTFVTGMVEAAFEQVVPEPGVVGVMGMALVGTVGVGRRRR